MQDLRAVNAVMAPMGATQPGLPSPVGIPKDWHMLVLDLKDCFFSIPLHLEDAPRFAFTLPSINLKAPSQRFHWVVLPQGMMNSSTICQIYVDKALEGIRSQFPNIYLIHYMDDLLIAAETRSILWLAAQCIYQALATAGLVVAPDKIQTDFPYQYLGHQLLPTGVTPQNLTIRLSDVKTLNDLQSLLGDINWIRPILHISTGQLKPLFDILKGDPDPSSPRQLSKEGRECLQLVQHAIQNARVSYVDYKAPMRLLVFPSNHAPTAVFWQTGPIYWVHSPASTGQIVQSYPTAVISLLYKACKISLQIFGKYPDFISIPYDSQQVAWLQNNIDDWSVFCATVSSQLINHYPSHPLVQFFKRHPVVFPKIIRQQPILGARVVFTDGSAKGKAAIVSGHEERAVSISHKSAQAAEIAAVLFALQIYHNEPLNVYTDSCYVAHVILPLETTAYIAPTSSVYFLLLQLQQQIWQRTHPLFIGHIRAHTSLPGPLSEGNARADALTQVLHISLTMDPYEQAVHLHKRFHLNAASLRLHAKVTREQATQIVTNCEVCAQYCSVPSLGVNPRGLLPNHVWQMDVTHVPSFGKLQYVHVSVDTYSHIIYASAHSGEKLKDVKSHCLQAFAYMGIPKQIKTDNGPAYISQGFEKFCKDFNITHKTGIPYNPQGQAIVERANRTLKVYLEKIKKGDVAEHCSSPHSLLASAIYVLNFLTVTNDVVPAERHWLRSANENKGQVKWKDLATNKWRGPDPVLTWGRGSVCVFPQDEESPRWVPERLTRQISLAPTQHDPTPNDVLAK